MEANAVIWIWNYISFMLHYHFMVVMTERRWNIYRLFRRHLSNTFPEGHLGLKIHYPFAKLGPEPPVPRSQPIRTSFPHFNPWHVRDPSLLSTSHSFWKFKGSKPEAMGLWPRCYSLWNGLVLLAFSGSWVWLCDSFPWKAASISAVFLSWFPSSLGVVFHRNSWGCWWVDHSPLGTRGELTSGYRREGA